MALIALILFLFSGTLVPAGARVVESGSFTSPQASRAALTVVRAQPLTVAGRGFRAGERVKLKADGLTRSLTAGARGSFTISFPEANTCNSVLVVARGSKGSRAAVTFGQFSNVHCLEPNPAG
jgi:hypothetical protein